VWLNSTDTWIKWKNCDTVRPSVCLSRSGPLPPKWKPVETSNSQKISPLRLYLIYAHFPAETPKSRCINLLNFRIGVVSLRFARRSHCAVALGAANVTAPCCFVIWRCGYVTISTSAKHMLAEVLRITPPQCFSLA